MKNIWVISAAIAYGFVWYDHYYRDVLNEHFLNFCMIVFLSYWMKMFIKATIEL